MRLPFEIRPGVQFDVRRGVLRACAAACIALTTSITLAATASPSASSGPPRPTSGPEQRARIAPVAIGARPRGITINLAHWGLEQADLSLLTDLALARKARVASFEALDQAAEGGDPVAVYLRAHGKRNDGDDAGWSRDMSRAANLGLVRAISVTAVKDFLSADTAQEQTAAYEALSRASGTGNAFSANSLAFAISQDTGRFVDAETGKRRRHEANDAMLYAADAGFAPSMLQVARALFNAVDRGSTQPGLREKAQALLDRGVAQGDGAAIDYARERAARKVQ